MQKLTKTKKEKEVKNLINTEYTRTGGYLPARTGLGGTSRHNYTGPQNKAAR